MFHITPFCQWKTKTLRPITFLSDTDHDLCIFYTHSKPWNNSIINIAQTSAKLNIGGIQLGINTEDKMPIQLQFIKLQMGDFAKVCICHYIQIFI